MLLGEYEHTIDDKSRLTLPAKFRESFAEGIVLTRGMDGCLYAYTRSDWDRLVETRLSTLDPLSREGRLMQRYFFASAAALFTWPLLDAAFSRYSREPIVSAAARERIHWVVAAVLGVLVSILVGVLAGC